MEIDLGGAQQNHPARLVCFFSAVRSVPLDVNKDDEEDPLRSIYAIVHYYDVVTWEHAIVRQPLCRESAIHEDNYHVVSIRSILGHAHMVPDFDFAAQTQFFWDRV